MGLRTWLRQRLCKHSVFIDDIKRHDGFVTANCRHCGKPMRATYGLALPATLEQRQLV